MTEVLRGNEQNETRPPMDTRFKLAIGQKICSGFDSHAGLELTPHGFAVPTLISGKTSTGEHRIWVGIVTPNTENPLARAAFAVGIASVASQDDSSLMYPLLYLDSAESKFNLLPERRMPVTKQDTGIQLGVPMMDPGWNVLNSFYDKHVGDGMTGLGSSIDLARFARLADAFLLEHVSNDSVWFNYTNIYFQVAKALGGFRKSGVFGKEEDILPDINGFNNGEEEEHINPRARVFIKEQVEKERARIEGLRRGGQNPLGRGFSSLTVNDYLTTQTDSERIAQHACDFINSGAVLHLLINQNGANLAGIPIELDEDGLYTPLLHQHAYDPQAILRDVEMQHASQLFGGEQLSPEDPVTTVEIPPALMTDSSIRKKEIGKKEFIPQLRTWPLGSQARMIRGVSGTMRDELVRVGAVDDIATVAVRRTFVPEDRNIRSNILTAVRPASSKDVEKAKGLAVSE